MKTYFCRHSSKLDIDRKTFDYLWENDYMAIHYPISKEGWKEEGDCESINPNDYSRDGKKALNALHALSKNGGYVFTVYENQNDYKIGYVEPNTTIEIIRGKWGSKNGTKDRTAILKGVRFTKSLTVNSVDALSLSSVQPRQGTICVWAKAGNRVQNIMNGVSNQKELSDLTPDLQEVLVSEYLRTGLDPELPKIESLLTPVGRTMKDVDIIGLAENKKRVIVQVTYSFEPQWKINNLKKYSGEGDTELIIFCKTQNPRRSDGVLIYSIDEAFNRFCNTEAGRNWLEKLK